MSEWHFRFGDSYCISELCQLVLSRYICEIRCILQLWSLVARNALIVGHPSIDTFPSPRLQWQSWPLLISLPLQGSCLVAFKLPAWAKDLTLALWLRKLGFILCAHSIKIQNRKITIISNNLKSSAPWRWLKASENSHGIYAVTFSKCLRDLLNVWYIYSIFCINRMNIFRKVQSPPSSRTFKVLSSWGSRNLKLLHLCQRHLFIKLFRHLSNGSEIYKTPQTFIRSFP